MPSSIPVFEEKKMSSAEVGGDACLALPAQCGNAATRDLHGALLEAAGAGAIRIDASAVSSIGQSVLQLLLSARRTAESGGQAFDIAAPSAEFSGTLTRCQLAELLTPLPARSAGE